MVWLFVPGVEPANSGSGSRSVPPIEPSLTVSGKPMRRRAWYRAWARGWIRRLSGLISEPSTLDRGVESWISSLRACRASHTQSPELAEGATTIAGSGPSSFGSFAVFPLRSSCSKTSPASSQVELFPMIPAPPAQSGPSKSAAWPRWGTWARGEWCELPTSERPTVAPVCSALLPTPTASYYGTNSGGENPGHARPSLWAIARSGLWPTPLASDAKRSRTRAGSRIEARRKDRRGLDLATEVEVRRLWPTPMASDATRGSGSTFGHGESNPSLPLAVKLWPSPTASDSRSSRRDGYMLTGHPGTTLTDAADPGGAGKLSPAWVEWLMGWPIGWSAFASAEEESFPSS
jgi:hypothetical protein